MPVFEVDHRTTYRCRRPVGLGAHRLTPRPRDSRDHRLIETGLRKLAHHGLAEPLLALAPHARTRPFNHGEGALIDLRPTMRRHVPDPEGRVNNRARLHPRAERDRHAGLPGMHGAGRPGERRDVGAADDLDMEAEVSVKSVRR